MVSISIVWSFATHFLAKAYTLRSEQDGQYYAEDILNAFCQKAIFVIWSNSIEICCSDTTTDNKSPLIGLMEPGH